MKIKITIDTKTPVYFSLCDVDEVLQQQKTDVDEDITREILSTVVFPLLSIPKWLFPFLLNSHVKSIHSHSHRSGGNSREMITSSLHVSEDCTK